MRLRLLLVSAFFLIATACGSKQLWTAFPAQGDGVRVDPIGTWVSGGKLWVRVTVSNGSPAPIEVVRDAVVCVLPNGQRLGRAMGSTTVHTAYMIPPGGAHAVFVEFSAQGFDWDTVPDVNIDFSPAMTRGGQPINVAPLPIRSGRVRG